MATTTEAAIRTSVATAIAATVPTMIAGQRFREHEQETEFIEWCENSPDAAFRRFVLTDTLDRAEPVTTNTDSEWREARLELLVAYPENYKYGKAGRRAREEVMRADQDALVRATGLDAYASFPNVAFIPARAQYGQQTGRGLVFLRFLIPFGFYRSIP